jgi:hypothetical protein
MGGIERLLIEWISQEQERLSTFLAILADEGDEEQGQAVMREVMAREIPHCGEFWRELMLQAIADADWEAVADALTDRRREDAGQGAWLLLDRRKS